MTSKADINKPKESNTTHPKRAGNAGKLALTMCTLLSSQGPYAPGLDLAAVAPGQLSKLTTRDALLRTLIATGEPVWVSHHRHSKRAKQVTVEAMDCPA
jgi:hypothetical protein